MRMWRIASANTRIYELQNAIEFRNPQDDADAAGAA